MKIVKAKIDDLDRLAILVDHHPDLETLTFTAYPFDFPPATGHPRPPGTLFVAQDPTGYVRFMVETPDDPTGSYGVTLRLSLDDGTTRDVVGPWSSNPDFVNSTVPGLLLHTARDVSLYSTQYSFDQASGGNVAHLTESAARALHEQISEQARATEASGRRVATAWPSELGHAAPRVDTPAPPANHANRHQHMHQPVDREL